MKTFKKINHVVALVMIAATLLFTVSCKKEDLSEPAGLLAANSQDVSNLHAFSPWLKRSSGVAAPHHAIIEMSTFGEATCYGLMYDDSSYLPYQDISITHNGGATWRVQNIAGLENNYLYGVAATSSNTVHVIGWNYVNGGGNVFRSSDGGSSWKREAANAFTHPESFPNAIKFFNPKDGVMLGDPQDGYFENYITCDGGNNWRRVPSKRIPPPQENEYGWTYTTDISNNTIWTLTIKHDNVNILNARLFQSDDKGENWYVRNSSMPVTYGDVTMKFRNRDIGLFKNNGVLYRTTDGGTTWKEVDYSGTWFSFDFDNIPGLPGWWISTGGGYPTDDPRSMYGFGSSISYDDGNHWVTLDTTVNHTNADMTGPLHGYSGGITTGSGDDGVFVYSIPHSRLDSVVSAGYALTNNQKVNVPRPSGNMLLPGNKFAALRHHRHR